MNNFGNLQKRHEPSSTHVAALVSLITFGKTRIDCCLSQAFKESVDKFNENVKKNRHIQDEKLYNHLQTSTVFSGTSSDIQNDPIKAISSLMIEAIRKEITSFPSIIMDETTDISNKSQLSTVCRYITTDGERVNAFETLVQRRFPKAATTRWKYNSRLVEVVSAVQNDLDELIRSMMENHGLVQEDSITP
ncbi:hypothetical protein ILUMI_12700 [Ignelater luminosus]|uniref:DUF4371 domain-containing protein n=1 Tax=Ignelater luminosus TaxID=2038154 RepID=A0A8K0GCP4_IGNLU|nr:hypothetical protein ILUMI_12700 [Ignelater luminosus]